MVGNLFGDGDNRAQHIGHRLLEAVVEAGFPRDQVLGPVGADQAIGTASGPKRPGELRFRPGSGKPLPQAHLDAVVLLDIGKDQRAGIQPHGLHRDVAVVDRPAAAE